MNLRLAFVTLMIGCSAVWRVSPTLAQSVDGNGPTPAPVAGGPPPGESGLGSWRPAGAATCDCGGKPEPTCRDQWTLQVLSGANFAPCGIGPKTPTFDFLTEQIRLGWMCTEPQGPGMFRGNFETLLELDVSPIVDGFGSIVVGPSLMMRYNFVQPGWDLVPYVQGAAGVSYNDAFRDQSQRAIGEAFEFLLQAGVGAHYRVAERWSVDAEGEFFHISNGRLASRNAGINAFGASVGVTCLLP